MALRRDKPVWLVIVVTKADLFPDEVDEAVRYYSPGSGSPFAAKLDELRSLAGVARLSVDVLPMCTVPGEATGKAARKDAGKRCSAMLTALESRMGQLSGHA